MTLLTACVLIVTADTHSMGPTAELFDAMYEYGGEDAAYVVAGDLIDQPGQWDHDWTSRAGEYGFTAVPGNHDVSGFETYFSLPRGLCGDPDEPDFVYFGIDSERMLGSYGTGFRWARDNYPYTPWVVFTHRPFVSCTGRSTGLSERPFGKELISVMPSGSIVVAGHEHVWCRAHMEGWTQLIVSTGKYKRYDCDPDLDIRFSCERSPDYMTFVKLDPNGDELVIVGMTDQGITERPMSILEGEFPPGWADRLDIEPASP